MKVVNTPQGEVRLLPPPVELLRAIRAFMPFGAVRFVPAQQGADFGLVTRSPSWFTGRRKPRPVGGVIASRADCLDFFEESLFLVTGITAEHIECELAAHRKSIGSFGSCTEEKTERGRGLFWL